MNETDTAEISSIEDVLIAKQHNTNADIVDVDQALIKMVVFTIDGNWFAFHSEFIKEVLSDMQVSPLPGCPASLEGVINVRGDIESVISLRSVLNFEPLAHQANTRILIGATDGMRSGIRVDTVEEIIALPESKIQTAPSTLPAHMTAIVDGVFKLKDNTVTVLDMQQMFKNYRDALMG